MSKWTDCLDGITDDELRAAEAAGKQCVLKVRDNRLVFEVRDLPVGTESGGQRRGKSHVYRLPVGVTVATVKELLESAQANKLDTVIQGQFIRFEETGEWGDLTQDAAEADHEFRGLVYALKV